MKKILLLTTFISGFAFLSNAQVEPHAIGLRGGSGNFGYAGEISYQHGFGDANRLELDLGWRGNNGWGDDYQAFAISGIYHWVWNIEAGFNWFAGPGGQIGAYQHYYYDTKYDESGINLGVGGQIGIEYNFNEHGVPLQMGLDLRPMWGFFGSVYGLGYAGAFSIRYTF